MRDPILAFINEWPLRIAEAAGMIFVGVVLAYCIIGGPQ